MIIMNSYYSWATAVNKHIEMISVSTFNYNSKY